MTTIIARLAPGRSISETSFSDLTTAKVSVAWGAAGMLQVTLTPDVSADIAASVRCRIISQTTADESARRSLRAALLLPKSTTAERLTRLEALIEATAELLLENPLGA